MTRPNNNEATNSSPESNRILVPIDFSDCTAEVVDAAINAARNIDGQLVLLHVVDLPDGATDKTPVAGGPGAAEALEQEATTRLREHLQASQDAGVQASTLTVRGDPAEAILAAADRGQVKQIVMGTHGRSGVSRWLLGSVANRVMRRSPVPVQVVRFERKPSCGARSCAWCPSHVTSTQKQLSSELDG